jgi:hypothetical protein
MICDHALVRISTLQEEEKFSESPQPAKLVFNNYAPRRNSSTHNSNLTVDTKSPGTLSKLRTFRVAET